MECTRRALTIACGKYFGGRFGALLSVLSVLTPTCVTAADASWPQIRLPEQIQSFDVGREMAVNGVPVRIRGFVSQAHPVDLAASFRKILVEPVMEDRRGEAIVLGRADGRYYLTVELKPFGEGTRGLIAVTKPPLDPGEPVGAADVRRLLAALPPGSTLASHSSSSDGGTRADHDAVVNSHSTGINAEYLKRMFRADGFTLEREATPSTAQHRTARVAPDARTLFFKRAGAEAMAVVFTAENGRSVIVLNRVFTGHSQ